MRLDGYRSLRSAYLALKPNMTYLAFYKRVKGGMSLADAATQERQKGGRVRKAPLPWEN